VGIDRLDIDALDDDRLDSDGYILPGELRLEQRWSVSKEANTHVQN